MKLAILLSVGSTPSSAPIFYLDPQTGYGLIAAPEDRPALVAWSPTRSGIKTHATASEVGRGQANTYRIAYAFTGLKGDFAAKEAREWTGSIFPHSDPINWYLPSIDELHTMIENLGTGFKAGGYYWSSTEDGPADAWAWDSALRKKRSITKWQTLLVRPVRAFGPPNRNYMHLSSFNLVNDKREVVFTLELEPEGGTWQLADVHGRPQGTYTEKERDVNQMKLEETSSGSPLLLDYKSGKAKLTIGVLQEYTVSVDWPWVRALESRTPEAFEAAVSNAATLRHREDAKWRILEDANRLDDLIDYLTKNPESRYADAARVIIDTLRFSKAKQRGTPNAYREYLDGMPGLGLKDAFRAEALTDINTYTYNVITEIKYIKCRNAQGDEFSIASGERLEVGGFFSAEGKSLGSNPTSIFEANVVSSDEDPQGVYRIPGELLLKKGQVHDFGAEGRRGAYIITRNTESEFARVVPILQENDDTDDDDPFDIDPITLRVSDLPNDGASVSRTSIISAGTGQVLEVGVEFRKLDHVQMLAWHLPYSFKCGDEFPKQEDLQKPPAEENPGFFIRNETMYDLDVSLHQVGPLYWETIKPGEIWGQDTGAVWFTIKARVNLTGAEQYSWEDAAWPVAKVTGQVIVGALTGGATAGFSGGLLAAKTAAAGSYATKEFAATSVLIVGKQVVKNAGTRLGAEALATNCFAESFCSASMGGCWAGPEWPFRRDRKMYRITGGPKLPCYDEATNEVKMFPSEPLKIIEPN